MSRVRPVVPDPSILHLSGPGLFGKRRVVGVREAACLWHPPGARGEDAAAHGAQRPGRRPCRRHHDRHAPEDPLPRHHLYLARTRMGKSHPDAPHRRPQDAGEGREGRDGDAIVVVDPHADLVGGLLEHVPDSLIDSVRIIDLADERGAPGVNLLDTRIFSDRDRTADSVVWSRSRGLWGPVGDGGCSPSWNRPSRASTRLTSRWTRAEQYTILDGLRLLADEEFRSKVVEKVNDP